MLPADETGTGGGVEIEGGAKVRSPRAAASTRRDRVRARKRYEPPCSQLLEHRGGALRLHADHEDRGTNFLHRVAVLVDDDFIARQLEFSRGMRLAARPHAPSAAVGKDRVALDDLVQRQPEHRAGLPLGGKRSSRAAQSLPTLHPPTRRTPTATIDRRGDILHKDTPRAIAHKAQR